MCAVTAGPEMVQFIQAQSGINLAKSTHCPGASERSNAKSPKHTHSLARTLTRLYDLHLLKVILNFVVEWLPFGQISGVKMIMLTTGLPLL